LERASKLPQLGVAARDRVSSLSREELAEQVKAGLREAAVEQAVAFYSTCGSWDAANYVTEALMLPLLPYLKREHIEKIIRSPEEEKSDLRGSFGFEQFLHKVRAEKVIEPDELDALLTANGLEVFIPDAPEPPNSADELSF
jgi:hypothetical protein